MFRGPGDEVSCFNSTYGIKGYHVATREKIAWSQKSERDIKKMIEQKSESSCREI